MKYIESNSLKNGDILLFHSPKGCFSKAIQCWTSSKFSHIGMVLENPIYINPDLNKGLYLLESGSEGRADSEDHTKKIGVQIQLLNPILNEYGQGNVYCRKLNSFTPFSTKKMKEIHDIIHNKPYDLNIVDWAEAMVDDKVPIFRKKTTDRFWCSALVTFIYVKLGYLPNQTYWSLVSPENWNDKKKFFVFQNCQLSKVQKVKF
ncbi:hypothetical protein CPAV1605_472 [seawater metagenome]|uniref:Permuted papain-like amidase enzyme, YaeF/YiiX, C92 family n=1 Tax=seawater metagenome TaxID=1561972 RepID=A0A5E8CI42_9ZZZZ